MRRDELTKHLLALGLLTESYEKPSLGSILSEFHDTAFRNRSTRSTSDRFHVAIWDVHRPLLSSK
jgi:hypothetical protein